MSVNIYSSTVPHRYRNRFLRDSGSNISIIGGGSSSSSSSSGGFTFEPHYLWGQYFDDTQDISGDLTGVGSITASGVINASGITLSDFVIAPTVSGTNAVFDTGVFYSGITSNSAIINNISGDTVVLSQSLTAPTISGNSIIGNNISGTNASITSLTATAITSNTINVTNKLTTNQLEAVSGYIKTLLSDEITVDYLTVTKAAHFFKLLIDEIKATQGQIIITPCNAVIDKVETVSGNYRCYFRAKDDDREIYNNFEVNDQVVCQTFNVATGVSYNVSNTYYWRLCVATGTTSTTIDGETVECHYIDLSDRDKDSYSISAPAKGDNVVQLGNRNDSTRQAAIIISAYNQQFLDPTIKAPSIVQYQGINNYNLQNHRKNVISKDFNEFVGNFKTSTGDDIEELIEDVTSGITAYLHKAWANSADGSLDFTKNPSGGSYAYIGFCSNNTESDANLVYSDYSWSYIKGADGTNGENGDDAEFYRLVPIIEKAIVDKNGTLGVQFSYQIAHVSGSSVTTVTATTSGYWVRVMPNNSSTYYNLSTNTTTPNYTNSSFITNYHKQSSKPTYFTVYLVSGSSATVKDQKTVSVIFDAGATLEVTDEINATVQGHSETISSHTNSIATLNANYSAITTTVESNTNNISNLSGTVTSHTNSISQLQQTSSSLTSTVSAHTNQINSISGTVTSHTASISQLQQTSSSLTSTVSSHTQSISQLQQTSTSLTSTVQSLQNTVSQIELAKKVTVDATSLSENYCYPVVISFGGDNSSKSIRCNVSRTLNNSYGVPSYGINANGFSIDVDWTTKASGWGANRVNEYWSTSDDTRYISDYQIHWVTYNGIQNNPLTPIVGSIGQVRETSEEIVYVRGGSKYDIATSYSNATITLYSDGYTWTRGEHSGSRPIISYSSLVIPVQDARTYSEIVQTATNIELNVFDELKNKTGINVSAGTITLDADNTTIVGNLNLTDTNNGLTMYDNESIPRVNIQPTKIDTTYRTGKYDWYIINKTETGHSKFYLELNTVSLGNISSGYDIAIYYASIVFRATSGSYTSYPSYPALKTQIYCNGSLVKDFGYYGVTWERNGIYNFSTPLIYTTKAGGTYGVKFTLSSTTTVSTSYSVVGWVDANIQWDLKAQTQIFTDGMLSQSAPNNYMEVKPDRVEMRQGTLGFRLISDNNSPSANMFKGIQTIVGFRGSTPDVYPTWLPFHNFTPTFSCGDGKRNFTYQSITNINQYKYAYQISPYNDYGIMIINSPAYDSSLNKQDTWVMLPPLNFTGENNTTNQLPIGYTITIINNIIGSQSTNVYVVPSVLSQNTGMIIDSNKDTQYYSSLNGNQTCDTYIYVGSWPNGTSNVMYWRSIHDTQ